MKYKINIEFKKGPGFSCSANAPTQRMAELAGLNLARESGFDGAVKSVRAEVAA